MIEFKSFTTQKGEELLYTGFPDLSKLDELADGPGDLWHSSRDQGFFNCFPEIMYQAYVTWWFLNDMEQSDLAVNWRVNSDAFVVRKSIYELTGGLDFGYEHLVTSGIDFGYNLLRNYHGIPVYIKGLFEPILQDIITLSRKDRYRFFFRNFKNHHAFYMLLRKGIFQLPFEFSAYRAEKSRIEKRPESITVPIKELRPIEGKPKVSLVIPTMKRQSYTQLVLEDHKKQTYLIDEVVIVDATPENERSDAYYRQEDFPFRIKLKWQSTKGSCRARNEALEMCTGDYIIFADDDIRIPPTFVENHIRFLQTYKAGACNGLDIMAKNENQDLSDLKNRLELIDHKRWKVGASYMFSNANSCVRKDIVDKLIGNDINFDGGYGEDSDYGLRILKSGHFLLHNPFSPNLHLKPQQGGYRWWGAQSSKKGKKRKAQPWELDNPVKYVQPVPSPTVSYGILKQIREDQIKEWKMKYFFIFLFKNDIKKLPLRVLYLPMKLKQFATSLKYAKALKKLGPRYR